MKRLSSIVGFLVLGAALRAQPVQVSLVAPPQPAVAGAETTIELVALNRGSQEARFVPPAAVIAELTLGGQSWRLELREAPDAAAAESIAPGRFLTRTYVFVPPAGLEGTAVLEAYFDGQAAIRTALSLTNKLPATASPPGRHAEPIEKPTTNLVRAEPAASVIQRAFANRLAPHEPVYFLYGPDAPAAKFQISFKYKLLQFTEVSKETRARTLQFAFTQRSLWDIDGASSPFYDTSYMPELIYESLTPKPEERETWFSWLGFQGGFRHESNGRDGLVSRSLNVVFARPVFAFGMLDGWHLLVVPELFTYVATLEDNPDIKDYRGYGRLSLVFGRNDGPSLMVAAWAGKDFDHATVQVDLTYPIRTKLLNFETYLLIQYFNGYGESLLSYRDQSEMVRAGISLVR